MVIGGIEEQTHQGLKNVRAVLEEAGFGSEDVVQVQIFLTDLENYTFVDKIYVGYFSESPPAPAVVGVVQLPKDALIEMLVTARKS
jgi:2-iminobutanoate/2-iminopropanoate deaminase